MLDRGPYLNLGTSAFPVNPPVRHHSRAAHSNLVRRGKKKHSVSVGRGKCHQLVWVEMAYLQETSNTRRWCLETKRHILRFRALNGYSSRQQCLGEGGLTALESMWIDSTPGLRNHQTENRSKSHKVMWTISLDYEKLWEMLPFECMCAHQCSTPYRLMFRKSYEDIRGSSVRLWSWLLKVSWASCAVETMHKLIYIPWVRLCLAGMLLSPINMGRTSECRCSISQSAWCSSNRKLIWTERMA